MIRQTAARVSEAVEVLAFIANAPETISPGMMRLAARKLIERWEWEDEKAAYLSDSQMNICNRDKQG